MPLNLKRHLQSLGPGLITGASDDDPSGIATYSQAGAVFGYAALWTMLFTWPLMTAVQEMCSRIAIVSGKGLGANLRARSQVWVGIAVLLVLAANTVNIAADLSMMASSAHLVIPVPVPLLLIVFVCLGLILEVFLSYRVYARYLKWLTLALLGYIIVALITPMDWRAIFSATVFPSLRFDREYLYILLAIIGTTISPYLFFWQAGQEVEERHAHHLKLKTKHGLPRALEAMRFDTGAGMAASNIVGWFVMLTALGVFFLRGLDGIHSVDRMAQLLVPIAGPWSGALFALGIVGTGLLAVPVLAGSAAYALGESVGWKVGLDRKWNQAKGFYGVITASTLIGLIFGLLGFDPVSLLIGASVLNAIIMPPLLIMLLLIANDREVMGEQRNGLWSNLLVGATLTLVVCAAAALVWPQI